MPIVNGKYTAPAWVNNGPPAIGADELNAMSGTIESSQILTGAAAPTTSTAGAVGQLYLAMISSGAPGTQYPLYQCVAVSGSTYTWKKVTDGIDSQILASADTQLEFYVNTDQTRNLSELLVQIGNIVGQKATVSAADTSTTYYNPGDTINVQADNKFTQNVSFTGGAGMKVAAGRYVKAVCSFYNSVYAGVMDDGSLFSITLHQDGTPPTYNWSAEEKLPVAEYDIAPIGSVNGYEAFAVGCVVNNAYCLYRCVLGTGGTVSAGPKTEVIAAVGGATLRRGGVYAIHIPNVGWGACAVGYYTVSGVSRIMASVISFDENGTGTIIEDITINSDLSAEYIYEVNGVAPAVHQTYDRLPFIYSVQPGGASSSTFNRYLRFLFWDRNGQIALSEERLLDSGNLVSGQSPLLLNCAITPSPSVSDYFDMYYTDPFYSGAEPPPPVYAANFSLGPLDAGTNINIWVEGLKVLDHPPYWNHVVITELPPGSNAYVLASIGLVVDDGSLNAQEVALVSQSLDNPAVDKFAIVPIPKPASWTYNYKSGLFSYREWGVGATGVKNRMIVFPSFGGNSSQKDFQVVTYHGTGEDAITDLKSTYLTAHPVYAGAMLYPGIKAGTQIKAPGAIGYCFIDDYLWVQRVDPARELLGTFQNSSSTSAVFDLSGVNISEYSAFEIAGVVYASSPELTFNGIKTGTVYAYGLRSFNGNSSTTGAVKSNYIRLTNIGNSNQRRLWISIHNAMTAPAVIGILADSASNTEVSGTVLPGTDIQLQSIEISGLTGNAQNTLQLYGVR